MSQVIDGDTERQWVVHVYGVEGSVLVTGTHSGITLKPKGCKAGEMGMTWRELADLLRTPEEIPSRFYCKPIEWWNYLLGKRALNKIRREEDQQ